MFRLICKGLKKIHIEGRAIDYNWILNNLTIKSFELLKAFDNANINVESDFIVTNELMYSWSS